MDRWMDGWMHGCISALYGLIMVVLVKKCDHKIA
jgi:hypothetical protein